MNNVVVNIPDKATNEDVLNFALRAVFPKVIFIHGYNKENQTQYIVASEEWLNAPYKKGGAE